VAEREAGTSLRRRRQVTLRSELDRLRVLPVGTDAGLAWCARELPVGTDDRPDLATKGAEVNAPLGLSLSVAAVQRVQQRSEDRIRLAVGVVELLRRRCDVLLPGLPELEDHVVVELGSDPGADTPDEVFAGGGSLVVGSDRQCDSPCFLAEAKRATPLVTPLEGTRDVRCFHSLHLVVKYTPVDKVCQIVSNLVSLWVKKRYI